jgi:hypothetical protein
MTDLEKQVSESLIQAARDRGVRVSTAPNETFSNLPQEDEPAAADETTEVDQAVKDVLAIAKAIKDEYNDRNDFDILFRAAIQVRFGPDFLAHHQSRRQLY